MARIGGAMSLAPATGRWAPRTPPHIRFWQTWVLPKVIMYGEPVRREILAEVMTRKVAEVVN